MPISTTVLGGEVGLTKILFSFFENVLILNKIENQFSPRRREFVKNVGTKSSNEPQEALYKFYFVHFLGETEHKLT